MIFNKSVFKKMLKTAYKGRGLLVAKQEERFILAGGYWVITIDEDYFPNSAKAALVELTGRLPEHGDCFRSTSGGNQIEMMPQYALIDELREDLVKKTKPFEITKVLAEGIMSGLVRYVKRGNVVVPINEMALSLIDITAVEDGESSHMEGPFAVSDEANELLWYTETCSLAVMRLEMEKEEYKNLEEVLSKAELPTRK